jgi:hypothetical protein
MRLLIIQLLIWVPLIIFWGMRITHGELSDLWVILPAFSLGASVAEVIRTLTKNNY